MWRIQPTTHTGFYGLATAALALFENGDDAGFSGNTFDVNSIINRPDSGLFKGGFGSPADGYIDDAFVFVAGDKLDFYVDTVGGTRYLWMGLNGTWRGVPGVSGGYALTSGQTYYAYGAPYNAENNPLATLIALPDGLTLPSGGSWLGA